MTNQAQARHVLDDATQEVARTERLLEIAHVAHRLSVSLEYARRLCRAGKIPAIRLEHGQYRIERRDLEAYISARRDKRPHNNPEPPAP